MTTRHPEPRACGPLGEGRGMTTFIFKCQCGRIWTDQAESALYPYGIQRACPVCVVWKVTGRPVRGVYRADRKCSAACKNATSNYCECQCAGAAHGKNRAWTPMAA